MPLELRDAGDGDGISRLTGCQTCRLEPVEMTGRERGWQIGNSAGAPGRNGKGDVSVQLLIRKG